MTSSQPSKDHSGFLFFCQMFSLIRDLLLGFCSVLSEILTRQELRRGGFAWNTCTVLVVTTTVAAATSIPPTTTATIVIPESPNAEDGVPQFHSPQLRLTVKLGDPVLLPCKIHNLGDNHVIWRHGTNVLAGTNVSTYADERIQLLEDLTLKISGASRDDEGEYECIVSGPFFRPGLVHSLTVHDAPTVSLITPTNVVVLEGENLTIGCIPHGNPIPRITWSMRDGQLQIPKSMLNLHQITLEKVSRRHAGLYVCTADNSVGRPAIGAVYVRVLYSPEIETPKRRVHGGVGYKAQLVCLVHADPLAEVTWRVGQELVPLSERVYTEHIGHTEHVLVFSRVKERDFKSYSCIANNSRGYDIRHIDFIGVPSPPIISRWETQILVKGMVGDGIPDETRVDEEIRVTLFWGVECYSPLIDYRLHFRPDRRMEIDGLNEDRIPPWTELTIPADQSAASFIHTKAFTLRGLQHSTIYEAVIKARNKYGWSTLSDICYFSTFPNSSSSREEELRQNVKKWRESLMPDGKDNLRLPIPKEEYDEYVSSSTGFGLQLLGFEWLLWFGIILISVFCVT